MADQRNPSPISSAHYPSDFSLYSDHPQDDYEIEGEDLEDVSPVTGEIESSGGALRLSGLGQAHSPHSFNEVFDPKPSPLVLRYRGYLKAEHDLRIEDVQRLKSGGEICDRMVDFLLAHAHAVQYELRRSTLSRVIIFPTGFGECLVSSIGDIEVTEDSSRLESMLRRVAMYKLEEIWEASLLLVPVPISRHWILIAITNPCKANAKDSSRSGVHDLAPGELKPDREPFTILLLNSAPLHSTKSISKVPITVRKFLEFSWRKLKSTSLEFVDWSSVRCPEQFDSVSCGLHVVRNSEILMREGIAEKIRRASQPFQPVSHLSPTTLRTLPSTKGHMESFNTSNLQRTPPFTDSGGSSLDTGPQPIPDNGPPPHIPHQPTSNAFSLGAMGEGSESIHKGTIDHRPSGASEEEALVGQENLIRTRPGDQGLSDELVLLGDFTNTVEETQETKAERRARKKQRKEEKRARKEATRLETAAENENAPDKKKKKKKNKRQRSPSPTTRSENAANDAAELIGLGNGHDHREAKRLKIGDRINNSRAQSITPVAEAGVGAEKKRRREDEDEPAPAALSPASAASPAHAAKRQRPLPSDPTSQPRSTLNDPQPSDGLPPGFDGLAQPSGDVSARDAVEGPTPEADPYGAPVHLPQAYRGYYSTCYYPDRKIPFQIPTGKLSAKARAERYKDLADDQVAAREAEYKTLSENYPLIFREAFKHTARGRLDRAAHLWLVPRVHNYYHTSQDGRSSLLDRIVRDLVHEFPDLHPNFLKLKDSLMEKEYLTSLRNLVSVATSGIKSTLENPSKVESINRDIVKQLTGANGPSRPHDLWIKSILDRLKEDELEADNDGDAGRRQEELAEARALEAEWTARYNQIKKVHGSKYATRHRLKHEQEFRKEKFGNLSPETQAIWDDLAEKVDSAIDPVTALVTALPFVNLVNKRFCEIAKVPMIIMVGAPDQQHPGQFLVYHDTHSSAPSEVPDFFDGPDRFGENTLIPAFRNYLALYFGASKENVATKGIPFPTPSEESYETAAVDSGTTQGLASSGSGENLGVTTPSGVSFVITPAPRDWTVPSKEADKIKSKLKEFLANSFKKAHGKPRFNFATLVSRFDFYIDPSLLPTTKITTIREADGKTVFKETADSHVVYPTDPMSMPWYQAKAYYDFLKDRNSMFAWRVEEPSTTGKLVNPPGSIQDSLRSSKPTNAPTHKDKRRRKRKLDQDVAVSGLSNNGQPAPSSSRDQPVQPSRPAKRNAQPKKKRNTDSEDEAVLSEKSDNPSDYTPQSETSKGQGSGSDSDPVYVLRPKTISRTGRLSAPAPNSALAKSSNRPVTGDDGHDDDSDEPRTELEDTTDPAPSLQRPTVTKSKTGSLLISPEKISTKTVSHVVARTNSPYMVKPTTEPELTDIPDSLVATLEFLPSLPGLDGTQHPPSENLQLFWNSINDPCKPIPTCLTAEKLATKAGTTVEGLATEVVKASLALVELLEGHDMLEEEGKDTFVFVSWTNYLLVLSRCLKFVESVDPMHRHEGREDLCILHGRVLELAVTHVIIRYCVGSILLHIADLPAPSESSSPTIANAIPTLSLCWVRMVKQKCCPTNQVWGPNWAHSVDPSAQLPQVDPFFHLSTTIKRWITIKATTELYDAILELERSLHCQPSLLEHMPIFTQATFFASIFAVHKNEEIRGSDDGWLGIIDKVLKVTEYSRGGSGFQEIERNLNQPPPTLISAEPQDPSVPNRQRPRPYRLSNKTEWSVGDIAKTNIDGVEKEVIFSYKQKDGRGRYLVMANPQTGKEIFAADGETELALPPFITSSLVKHGSRDSVAVALHRVHGYWDLPNLNFSDMARPELAGYFAQFSNLPDEDDDLDTLEKLGFKPPEFFIRQYEQTQMASATASASGSVEAPAVTPHPPELANPGPSPLLSSTDPSVHEKRVLSAHSPDNEGGTVELRSSGENGGDEATGAVVGEVNNSAGGRGGEVNEEEEVEHVLASKAESNVPRPGSRKKGKEKKDTAAAIGKQKANEEGVTTKVKPKTKKEQPTPKRTSARLQGNGAPGPSLSHAASPQPARRTSARNKQASNAPPPSTTAGPATRSRKKPE
ncbi:hypothetical protein M407DRAFT_6486 [Tulasnella calospora MUT 4182]|uniref:Ubiquitin-like protease family profile domain-containing protein n=1 Tax=Tulasnella calospora MUT 4182 TaxID=1051891 RepID=A0A0C3L5E3_9AGAM|nr:hypothetical protein M407DRAFT_6486 [Tulasnella calospora MUT 4182]